DPHVALEHQVEVLDPGRPGDPGGRRLVPVDVAGGGDGHGGDQLALGRAEAELDGAAGGGGDPGGHPGRPPLEVDVLEDDPVTGGARHGVPARLGLVHQLDARIAVEVDRPGGDAQVPVGDPLTLDVDRGPLPDVG